MCMHPHTHTHTHTHIHTHTHTYAGGTRECRDVATQRELPLSGAISLKIRRKGSRRTATWGPDWRQAVTRQRAERGLGLTFPGFVHARPGRFVLWVCGGVYLRYRDALQRSRHHKAGELSCSFKEHQRCPALRYLARARMHTPSHRHRCHHFHPLH